MKKLLIALLIAVTATFACTVSAEESKVEISFKVGDSKLNINGTEVEVETPYVAGDGTTLVPLRVITEAFGAQVGWEGQTQTITLKYPDVDITLQIGNIVAKVNDHNETLAEAPTLSENDVTMVPLRFISETFGADVSYNTETEAILVIKEKFEDAQTVTGVTEMARIGDSYYNWSINTPADMKMTDRWQDGRSTEFTADDESILYVDIYQYTEDTLTPFDEEYSKVKDSFSNYTLMEAEKLTDSAGNQYMYFQAKNSKELIDYREYYAKDYINYEVISRIKISEDTTIKDMILTISNSFKLGKIDDQTYDLSNVSGNIREIKSDKYRFSFNIPADFHQYSSEETENQFTFFKPGKDEASGVSLQIYSKSSETTAETMAHKDHDYRLKTYNPEFSAISDVESTQDGGYRYTHKISGSSKDDRYSIDAFFEKGEYVYNMLVTVPSEKDAAQAEKIFSSFETEELDAEKIGKLLRNDPDEETLVSNTIGNYKFSLPAPWKGITGIGTGIKSTAFVNANTGSVLTVMVNSDNSYRIGSLTDEAESLAKYVTEQGNNKMVGKIEYETIGGNRYAQFKYKMTDDDASVSYSTVYMTTKSKELIIFTLDEKDIHYHSEGSEVLKSAIESLTKK